MNEAVHPMPSQNDDPPLQQLVTRWNAAAEQWDPTALARCYTADAALFGGRSGHSIGRDAVKNYFDSYVGVIRSCAITLQDQEVSRLGDGLLVAQGHVDLSFILEDDLKSTSLLRSTLILRFEDTEWMVWRHHFSPVPAAPPLGNQ